MNGPKKFELGQTSFLARKMLLRNILLITTQYQHPTLQQKHFIAQNYNVLLIFCFVLMRVLRLVTN